MAKAEKPGREERRDIVPGRRFSEIGRIERDMERMFEEFFGSRWSPFRWGDLWPGRERGPRMPSIDVDVYEEKDEIVAKAELPGLSKDDISVSLTDSTLTIRGEKKKEDEVKDESYFYSERSYGSFARSIELPTEVQAEKVKANFKNGILVIRLPKSEQAKRKQIAVNIE